MTAGRARGQDPSLEALEKLCETLSADSLHDRGELLPKQPGDLGPAHLVRTLLSLAERAETAMRVGGPLERLARRAAMYGGPGCTVELPPTCKPFRRALEKAHQDYQGDYLRLNDMARCNIVAPKFSALAECSRWLVEDAAKAAMTEEELPYWKPLLLKDRLSPSYDAEGNGMYRSVVLVGCVTCDGGGKQVPRDYSKRSNPPRPNAPRSPSCVQSLDGLRPWLLRQLNVEIVLHIKRLFEQRKALNQVRVYRGGEGGRGRGGEREPTPDMEFDPMTSSQRPTAPPPLRPRSAPPLHARHSLRPCPLEDLSLSLRSSMRGVPPSSPPSSNGTRGRWTTP